MQPGADANVGVFAAAGAAALRAWKAWGVVVEAGIDEILWRVESKHLADLT